jgi:hypothetical protein
MNFELIILFAIAIKKSSAHFNFLIAIEKLSITDISKCIPLGTLRYRPRYHSVPLNGTGIPARHFNLTVKS